MRRWLIRLLWLLPPLMALALALTWLLATEAGLAWGWTRLEQWSGGMLQAERVTGRLAGPLYVEGLQLTKPGLKVGVAAVDLDWRPWDLLYGRLVVQRLALSDVTLELGESEGQSKPSGLGVSPLPFISLLAGEVRNFSLRLPGQEPVQVDELNLAGSWRGARLHLKHLATHGPWGNIKLAGPVAVTAGASSDLSAEWALNLRGRSLAGKGKLRGSFERPQLQAQLCAPINFTATASAAWQQTPLAWTVDFVLPPLALQELESKWPALTLGGRGRLSGKGSALSLTAQGEASEARVGSWQFDGTLEHGAEGWHLPQLKLVPQDGQGELVLTGRWPGTEGDASLEAVWSGLSLPRWPHALHSDGRLSVTGRPEQYLGQVELRAESARLPQLNVSTDFAGDLAGAELNTLNGRWLDGNWNGAGRLSWQDGLRWRGRLAVQGAELKHWNEHWQGRLDAEAQGLAEWVEGRLGAEFERLTARGTVAGKALTLEAAGRIDTVATRIKYLRLRSGAARLSAQGSVGERWGLGWKFSAPKMEELWPAARGRLDLAGRLDGERQQPRLRIDGSAGALAYKTLGLGEATLRADIDLAGKSPWILDTRLHGVGLGPMQVDTMRLQGDGSRQAHRLALTANLADGARLTTTAQGSWDGERWRGQLLGQLTAKERTPWVAAPAVLVWGKSGGSLQRWCWSGEGQFCAELAASEGGWFTKGTISALPLSLFEQWLPRQDLRLGGSLGIDWTFGMQGGAITQLRLQAAASEGRIAYRLPDGVVESLLRTATLDAVATEEGLRSTLLIELDEGGKAEAHFTLPGWRPGLALQDKQPLDGRFDLATHQLEWLTYLEPALARPKGELEAHLHLGGQLAEPNLSGEMSLKNGDVLMPAAGIHLTRLNLDGSSSDGRQLELKGSARSGPGDLAVSGRLYSPRLGQWRVEVGLQGKQFEVVRLTQARALVSPDLKVALERGLIEVSGQLTVPQADINLPKLPTTVETSPDEVILDASEDGPARRWRLKLDLGLAAGERVKLEGYGFSGRLTGAVRLRGETPGLTHAQGELNIQDGRYEAYGQNLHIQRGRLLFVDSPPDNPGLDVRAVRPLPDPEMVVGVEVSGRLKQPRMRVFSEPVMEESETLSWLVLGRPLTATSRTEADALYRAAFALGGERAARGIALQFGLDEVSVEQGRTQDQAAVVLGKYLSPRLYLQYGIGLWEATNWLRLRYQLSSHWTLKVEQGEQSGGDLLYTIDR